MLAQRTSLLVLMSSIGILIMGVLLLIPLQAVEAQCSDDASSSCCTCHAETHPVAGQGEWHEEHARRDCCWYCHGGNTQTLDKDLAHVGVVRQPLRDAYLSCHSCHPDDYHERAAKFAVVLKVTPGSSAPVTQTVALTTNGEVAAAPPPAVPAAVPPTDLPEATDQSGSLTIVGIVGALLVGLLVGLSLRPRKSAL